MVKPTLLLFLMFFLSLSAKGQLKKNELKAHPYIVFGELNLTYERILNDKLSIVGAISNSYYINEPTWENVVDCASIDLRYYFSPRTYVDSFFGSIYTKYLKESGHFSDMLSSGVTLGYKYAFKFGLVVEVYGGLGYIYIKSGELSGQEDSLGAILFQDVDFNGGLNIGYRF